MAYSQDYFLKTLNLLKKIFPKSTNIYPQYISQYDSIFVIRHKEIDDEIIYKYKNRNFLLNRFMSTHSLPSRKHISFYCEKNFKIFFSVRNPVHILISFANKQMFGRPDFFLKNYEWFENLAVTVKKFYELMFVFRNHTVLHYEKTILEPVNTIQELAKLLNLEIDNTHSLQIWKKLLLNLLRKIIFGNQNRIKHQNIYLENI